MAEKYHYVYVLRSEKDGEFYTGYTHDIDGRVRRHNNGAVEATKNRRPLKLVYWEACISREDATRREKYLKTAWGKRYIKGRLKYYLGRAR